MMSCPIARTRSEAQTRFFHPNFYNFRVGPGADNTAAKNGCHRTVRQTAAILKLCIAADRRSRMTDDR
ncbi:hypothetical protein QT972_04920 [Microcoleus sp. herbarium7]|uniref:hypothetical protein n=1 Tax=unclassified Microcoleus TaxID=2642155 RepID=UPI002FD60DD0